MNVFEKAIGDGRIASEEDLKRLFWKCAKRIHPDASGIEENHGKFISLKADFDEAVERFRAASRPGTGPASQADERTGAKPTARPARADGRAAARDAPRMDRAACVSLFVDLLASNFPADPAVRSSNKTYLNRVLSLNEGLRTCAPELSGAFLGFEKEMYALRGATTISNHPFNVVKLFLYRYGDFTYLPNKTNLAFLKNNYALVRGIFEERNMRSSIAFTDWLLGDVVTKGAVVRRGRAG